jgi:hypothetical protein
MTTICFEPLFGEADGYDGEGYDADGADRNGYNRDGEPVSVNALYLDLAELWDSFESSSADEFLAYLRGIVRNPGRIDYVVFCAGCGEPVWFDDTERGRGKKDVRICETCSGDDWAHCNYCENLYPDGELSGTLDESEVCESCSDNYYTYCAECDGITRYPEDHDHEDGNSGCDCESAQREFTVRNDGCEPLASDTRVTVTMPNGTISAEGLTAIRDYLRDGLKATRLDYSVAYDLEPLGGEWQTRSGNYTRRLSRHAYANYGIKLPPEILSQVGCIAREHSACQSEYVIAVTRELNMSAADFYHEDSCWWTSHSESRCMLKTNGGFGLRTFNEYGSVSGRAWVMPLRRSESGRLRPTFDTVTPDAFMVFNGYGELSGYSAARIVAHMAGWTYSKVDFCCEPMYVNAGGYLVAPEETKKEVEKEYPYGISLSVSQHASLFDTEQTEKTEKATAEKAAR